MIQKEVSEIKKRFRTEYGNIEKIHVCYVNSNHEILSKAALSTALMNESEKELYYGLFRKGLSGKIGATMNNIVFTTDQVMHGSEYARLAELRNSCLQDDSMLSAFYEEIIPSVTLDTPFVILMAYDAYDVPFRNSSSATSNAPSDEVFRYYICCVCPVTLSKARLKYDPHESVFHSSGTDAVIEVPEMAFLFPAFDDRSTNLYGALYYSRSSMECHDSFVQAVFHSEPPIPAGIQKTSFQKILSTSLSEDCSFLALSNVQNTISQSIEISKEMKLPDPPSVSCSLIADALNDSGIPEDKIQRFSNAFTEEFGKETELPAGNLINKKAVEIKTDDVLIRVNSERLDLIEAKKTADNQYISVRIDDSVSFNGIDFFFE